MPLVAQGQLVFYKVQPGEIPEDALPWEAKYVYPDFNQGTAFFHNGRKGGGRMNYNALLGEMQFINGADTMALAQGQDVRWLIIGADTFYFQKHWVRQTSRSALGRLGERKVLSLSNREKVGAFNTISSGSSIDAVEGVDNIPNLQKKMTSKQILTFSSFCIFYVADPFGAFVPASRKNLLDLFGNKRRGLDAFLQELKPDYTSKQDMEKVWQYINTGE
jgi:hypothetical protein